MPPITARILTVRRDDLKSVEYVETSHPQTVAQGQVLLQLEHFGLTSNNITYAVLGERMRYWNFFPTEASYGVVPVWGIAKVVASGHPDVKVGERFYGYYPMGTHLVVSPQRVHEAGFVDGSEHRASLPSVYNYYANTDFDPAIRPDTEALVAIYRPLFATSYLLEQFLADQQFFGASQLLVTSASSKTAQILAVLVAQRKERGEDTPSLIGLTSAKNIELVESLGWFDRAIGYDDLAQVDVDRPTVILDFSGNHATQLGLQEALSTNLAYNCLVGIVDWQHLRGKAPLPDPGTLFFAPEHAETRREQWGARELQARLTEAWAPVMNAIQPHVSMKRHTGFQELETLYKSMLVGKVDPGYGHLVTL